jgi:hypothetical protein
MCKIRNILSPVSLSVYALLVRLAGAVPFEEADFFPDESVRHLKTRKESRILQSRWTTLNQFGRLNSRLDVFSPCVANETALRKAVQFAEKNSSRRATLIPICNTIKVSSTKNSANVTGIDMSNRNIILSCALKNGKRCVLDGQRATRIFHGKKVTLTATDIDFINSYVGASDTMSDGTALSFYEKSSILLKFCSFRNSRNDDGYGTIASKDSSLTLMANATSPMIFFNNSAFSAPGLYASGGKVRARSGSVAFNNNTGFFCSAVDTYESDVSMKGVKFYGNKVEVSRIFTEKSPYDSN